jgi:transcriptional regulator with XRE-family HTH domain
MQNHLKARRESLKISQQALAEAMDVDRITVWRWETARSVPTITQMCRIGHFLQITPALLFPEEAARLYHPITTEPAHVS